MEDSRSRIPTCWDCPAVLQPLAPRGSLLVCLFLKGRLGHPYHQKSSQSKLNFPQSQKSRAGICKGSGLGFVLLRAWHSASICISKHITEWKCPLLFEKGEGAWERERGACCKKGKGFRALGQVVRVRCRGSAIYLNVRLWATCQIM